MASVWPSTPRAPGSGASGWQTRTAVTWCKFPTKDRLAFRWSPDSQKIAFAMKDPGGLWGVYIADTSTRVPHKLPTNVREISDPEWSHDGNWIYFRGYEGV